MNEKLIEKKEYLVKNIPRLIKSFSYRKGPDLYFYKKVISKVRNKPLKELLNEDSYIELLYITLVSWDMNARGAKMKYFDEFKSNILKNKDSFKALSKYKLVSLKENELTQVKNILEGLYNNLNLMRSKSRLVSNSKTMHFILPDLIMPMDRYNTLNFFFGNTTESKDKFFDLFECSYYIAKEIDLSKFLNDEWNQSIPKIIDNAIICENSPRYRL